MIDLTLVPEDVRPMAAEARTFTLDQWREITSNWNQFYQKSAIIFRRMGESSREEAIRESSDQFQSLLELGNDGSGGRLLVAIFCLTDDLLDLVISTLPRKVRKRQRFTN